ncbi:type IX secretion system sortase PorU [Kaistella flava (ex Peng et al. 2021)]|uniref:Type IX secretion system sortase PorU n=1 Tax=Kaistella flava (ex Peng et al. 2021) TaxID=2038776 RepID=A0A7M2Y889_9FLAO|nr:type IX secretion system sortase PorU [Kaistella flava (ex Peng et al. 2021)]QOW10316.1 type IX secretion system sortase PorU [Kaistella flava (ex Peng et al. 2021)]
MKRKLTFFLVLLFSSFYFSQTTKIDWEGSTVIDYGSSKVTVPFFKNESFVYEDGGVYLRMAEKHSGADRKVTNLIWEKISAKELFDINDYNLPTEDQSEVSYYTNPYTQEQINNIRVATLKFEKGAIYRLKSFTIVNAEKNVQNENWASKYGSSENPLKQGSFYKIKVDKSGVFKITAKFLRDNGMNPANINPKNFRIYGNGGLMLPEHNKDQRYDALQENAIQVFGEEDGVWNEDDYALFYAQGPNGYNVYKGSNGNGNRRIETRTDRSNNFINIYEDFAYYFINFDNGPGKRIQASDVPTNSTVISRYDEYQYINEEKFNLMRIGRIWTGDSFNGNKTVTFTTKSPIQPTDTVLYRSRFIAYQSQGNKMTVNINNANPGNFSVSSDDKREYLPIVYNGSVSNLQGNQLSFNYAPNSASNPNGKFYFDYAEVQYKEDLKFNNNQMNFRSYDIVEQSSNTYTFNLANASSIDQVWQVSDVTNVVKKVNKSGNNSNFNFGYVADSNLFVNEFVAFKNNEAFSPSFVGKIENQDLAGLQNIDYLMITVPEMMGQAQRLANFYQGKYNVAVVDINKIYNEFSSGSKDITAIRDFATRLNTPAGKLKYLFILGDTSYDFKGKTYPGSSVVPSYQSEESGNYADSFVTDDYFVMTGPQSIGSINVSATLPNLPVGRLPAANISEAKLLIDKALSYNNANPGQSTPFGEWRMKMDFVVDDDADNQYPFHNTMNASLVNVFETGTLRKEYNIRKLYLDAFPAQTSAGGQRYPQVNQAISNDVGNSLYLFYFGHGGINGWAQERVLTIEQIQNFNNYNNIYSRFPLVSTITCEFTLWDDPGTFSAGEQVIKSKTGGASTMITSSRAIGVGYGEDFTTIFTKHIFELENDDFLNLGDAFLQAKIEKRPSNDHLKVNFLGDPATKLSRPKRLITIDKIDSPVPGQLRALDFVKVKGHVTKPDGSVDETFNGRVAVNIFDKRLTKKTLNNDGMPKMSPVLTYTEEGSPIVKSSGVATNGVFTVEFYVPKDINYEVGTGRILVYADNKVFDVFNNQDQKIGGINPDGINDNEAPKVKLYMNNTNFADGGITNQNPLLLACVTDDKGINSTGSGIGHDITVILDGKIIDTVVLNDFFFSGEGNGCTNPSLADYQKGNVTYPFRNLTPGEHQLTFKVWDINNNSTTETLNFIVKDESNQNLIVKKLLNWPNPFTNKTYVQFEHNCNDVLDVNVQVYTITGKLVRTLSTTVTAEPFLQGFRTPRTAIEWDGNDDFGDAVGKGTYIFKIFARSQNQDKCKGSATAVEKMVLLK